MMFATIFLCIIYLTFISLGLPDSILGAAWPAMQPDFTAPYSFAGIISMIVTGGTIISSLLSGRLIVMFGTVKITVVSVLLTAISLLGFSFASHYMWICLLAIPLGIGAGAIDSVLNNFVALHYKAIHMNWLHCFWGIGATGGPLIISVFLSHNQSWRKGYFFIALFQLLVVAILIFSIPLWKRFQQDSADTEEKKIIPLSALLQKKGVKSALVSFFCYSSVELTTGLWGASYLVQYRQIEPKTAASYLSLFYLGITLGRFLNGLFTLKYSSRFLIFLGQSISALGAVFLLFPVFSQISFLLIGLGCAPIFPSMLHETPNRFGKELSQSLMGVQMAFSYCGSTLIPPLFGAIAARYSMGLFPFALLFFIGLMTLSTHFVNRLVYWKNFA